MSTAPVDPFAGVWNVAHATLPNGEFAYTGRIAVAQRGPAYNLEWEISAGRYVGVGLDHGGHLYVSCGEQRAGLGLLLLTRDAVGIKVRWATPELDGAGTGVFEADTFDGQHHLALHVSYGRLYDEWTLALRRNNAIYEAEWRKGEVVHFRGLGLELPDGVALGWYPDTSQLAFLDYELADASTLRARWALGGFATLGDEVLTRIG